MIGATMTPEERLKEIESEMVFAVDSSRTPRRVGAGEATTDRDRLDSLTPQRAGEGEGQMNGKWYKVLVNGRSCHGGNMAWSLPADGKPGEWHKIVGRIKVCQHGLHLTNCPPVWWMEGCEIFEAEYEGDCEADGDKIAVRKARLIRKVEDAAEVGIYSSGTYEVSGSAQVRAYGSAQVTASGSAQVRASDSAQVTAYDSAQVTAYDSARVTAYGSAQVRAYGSAQVTASGSAQVTAYGSAQVTASGSAQVRAYGSAQVRASGSAQVTAYDSALVTASDSAQVTASDSAQVTAYGSAQVWASDSAQVTAYDSARVRAYGSATVNTWQESPRVTLEHYAVWIERIERENGAPPKIHTAQEKK